LLAAFAASTPSFVVNRNIVESAASPSRTETSRVAEFKGTSPPPAA
jgi:hypothetical protein